MNPSPTKVTQSFRELVLDVYLKDMPGSGFGLYAPSAVEFEFLANLHLHLQLKTARTSLINPSKRVDFLHPS